MRLPGTGEAGTSPRAWGEVHEPTLNGLKKRNIPTGVGRRRRRSSTRRPTPEHPHGRGEKSSSAARSEQGSGTSPRAWGEALPARGAGGAVRNIPTGVGRRTPGTVWKRRSAEHPHGRGEKNIRSARDAGGDGTSPRAWGEVRRPGRAESECRNIPTGVGRSTSGSSSGVPSAEHPHGRGEKAEQLGLVSVHIGTSPRAWGEVRNHAPPKREQRNIPTGVGRSASETTRTARSSEHPHGRGEKRHLRLWLDHNVGTSPRAWGEVEQERGKVKLCRNIPTGVGRSVVLDEALNWFAEHPHGRGEKFTPKLARCWSIGTSPRAWGEGVFAFRHLRRNRNIPTGVGRSTA